MEFVATELQKGTAEIKYVGDLRNPKSNPSREAAWNLTYGSNDMSVNKSSIKQGKRPFNKESKTRNGPTLAQLAQLKSQKSQEAEKQRYESALQANMEEQLKKKRELEKKEATATVQRVVAGSATVTLGAGFEIQRIISGFDSCCVKINHLPLTVKHSEIIDLFSQQGINSQDVFLKSVRPLDEKYVEAEVLARVEVAKLMVFALDQLEFREERLLCSVSSNAGPDAMGSSRIADCEVLTVSWRAPSAAMIALYNTMEDVYEAIRNKDQKTYGGRKIKVEWNQPPTGPALRYYVGTAVKITGLPTDATPTAVATFMNARSANFIKSNLYDIDQALAETRKRLTQVQKCTLHSFEVVSRGIEDGYVKIQARFDTWEQAKRAATSLQGKSVGNTRCNFFVRLPPPERYTTHIALVQYRAQKRTWDELVSANNSSQQARMNIRTGDHRAFISVLGDDRRAIGSLKVRVENLIRGEKLDSKYWHRSFTSEDGRRFLHHVHAKTGAYIVSDFRLLSLKLYSTGDAKQKALEMINAEIKRLTSLEWSVLLKRRSVGFFLRKGLAILREQLGTEAVVLDLFSSPCKLIIRGGEDARHTVRRLIDESINEFDLIAPPSITTRCPVCYDQVTNPVDLACKHSYCTNCFKHFVNSVSETLHCIGNNNSCSVPIPLPVIQRFLTPQQFDRIVETIVKTYVDKHPECFRYCITPACPQIYACNSPNDHSLCPSCFVAVCTRCHEEVHTGLTCEERQLYKDPVEQERLNEEWAKTSGAKKCPKCQVWVEKIEGCNHMTCKCGAHICWKCMKIFEADMIYYHLNQEHGGVFDDPAV